ncbi:MAG TPA: thioredoxin TrxC [Rhodopila sp.]|nr:thioredoxin TrxC [Rhodopila sp.]
MADVAHIVCPHCAAVNRVPDSRRAEARCGECHQALFTGHPAAVSEATFNKHVDRNDVPVLVDIWASWCGPCRSMAPQFERAATTLEPEIRLLKLDADAAQDTCSRLGVRGIPALFLFKNGRVAGQTAGAMNADAIVRWTRDTLTRHAN